MVIIEGRKGRWGLLGLVKALDPKPFMCSNRLQITYHLTFIVTCMFVVASILRATTQHKTLVESENPRDSTDLNMLT